MSELVTLEQFAGYLKADLSEADAWTAQQLLDGAESAVREYCGWHIAPARTETLTADGSGSTLLELPTLHMTALAGVTESGTTVDLDGVEWSTNGLIERDARWCRRRRGVTATVTHGYDDPPPWLVVLICAVAARAFRVPVGVAAESAGGESVTYAQQAPGTAGAVLLLDQELVLLDRLAVPGRP